MAPPKRILEADDEAVVKMASNVDVKKYTDSIIKRHGEMDQIRSDIKSDYDSASNAGIDRKALKRVVKERMKPTPDDEKMLTNKYLGQLGQLALFDSGFENDKA